MNDMEPRTRSGKPYEAFPGPREVRYALELTTAYSNGLKDVFGVLADAFGDSQVGGEQYGKLLSELDRLLAPEGPLAAVQRECRRLLGET